MKKVSYYVIIAICVLIMAYWVSTITHAAAYTVYVADDFTHGVNNGFVNGSVFDNFKNSVKYSLDMYMNWQGTYFAMFIQSFFSPVNHFGLPMLRIIMVLNAVTLFATFSLFAGALMCHFSKNRLLYVTLVLTVLCFMACGYYFYSEIFTWFSGATSYSIPLSCLFISLFGLLKMRDSSNILYPTLAGFFGVCAMGGSLAVSGIGCYFAILFLGFSWKKKKKIPVRVLVITIIYLIFASINAFAPGNFVRKSTYEYIVDDSFFTALINSVYMIDQRFQFFFTETGFVLEMILLFFIGFISHPFQKEEIRNRVVFGILGLLTPFVAAVPVAYGYGVQAFPERCAFIFDFSIILSSAFCAITIGEYVSCLISKEFQNIVFVFGAMLAFIAFAFDGYGLSDVVVNEVSTELSDGTYEGHYEACRAFYVYLNSCEKGTDVVISRDSIPYSIDYLYNFYLDNEPDSWINSDIAQYYGLKSITVY